MIAVADPANGDDFMVEVCSYAIFFKTIVMCFIFLIYEYFCMQINKHWTSNSKPELTLEKLQKIATTRVPGQFKARWLKWWNSSLMSRVSLHLTSNDTKDSELDAWLSKASFWAQVPLFALIISSYFDECMILYWNE